MAFRLTKASCFVQGSWNIYIVQPDWLDRKQVWSDPESLHIETLRTGPGFRFFTDDGPLRLVMNPFRATIEARSETQGVAGMLASLAEAGSMLARLVGALPETPISGTGSNFHFRHTNLDPASVLPERRPSPAQVVSRGESVEMVEGHIRYLLHLSGAGPMQTDLTAVAIPAEASERTETASFVSQFDQHRRTAQTLAAQYWKISFDDV